MKKMTITIFFVFLLLGGLLSAHVVVVHSPKAGDVLIKKKNDPDPALGKISWSINNNPDDNYMINVNIMLYDASGTSMLRVLFTNTHGLDAIIDWWDYSSIPDGSYKIKVETVDDQSFAFSGIFKIQTVYQSMIPEGMKRIAKYLRKLTVIAFRLIYLKPQVPCTACPVTFYMKGVRDLLETSQIRQKIKLELYKNRTQLVNFGTFVPLVIKGKTVKFSSIPDKLLVKMGSPRIFKRIKPGPGYRLVIKNLTGKILAEKNISLKQL